LATKRGNSLRGRGTVLLPDEEVFLAGHDNLGLLGFLYLIDDIGFNEQKTMI
jgi:hypothetical protein